MKLLILETEVGDKAYIFIDSIECIETEKLGIHVYTKSDGAYFTYPVTDYNMDMVRKLVIMLTSHNEVN